jgi:hypothetical protein
MVETGLKRELNVRKDEVRAPLSLLFPFLPFSFPCHLQVLSDCCSGLMEFARGRRHILCYRHIVESVGARTYAAMFARRLFVTG